MRLMRLARIISTYLNTSADTQTRCRTSDTTTEFQSHLTTHLLDLSDTGDGGYLLPYIRQMYTKEEKLEIYRRIGVTKEVYIILRKLKDKEKQSMAKTISNLVLENFDKKSSDKNTPLIKGVLYRGKKAVQETTTT